MITAVCFAKDQLLDRIRCCSRFRYLSFICVRYMQVVKSLRRYSISNIGHPYFTAPAVLKLLKGMNTTMVQLSRFIHICDEQLTNTITEADLNYSLKCTKIRSSKRRVSTVLRSFPSIGLPGLKAAQKPRMNYGPFLRAICPTAAELYLEKQDMGIDASSPEYDTDMEAILVAFSADVFRLYVQLVQAILARDTNRSGLLTPDELRHACVEVGFHEFSQEDALFVLRYFHSEMDGKLDWELFMAVVAAAIDRSGPMAEIFEE